MTADPLPSTPYYCKLRHVETHACSALAIHPETTLTNHPGAPEDVVVVVCQLWIACVECPRRRLCFSGYAYGP